MSQPSRPRARGAEARRRRQHRIEALQTLEDRLVLTPFLTTSFTTATLTNIQTSQPVGGVVTNSATIQVTKTTGVANNAAGFTSITQLTPASAFGGDIVRIEAGPGGDFGKAVYAISRGSNIASSETTVQTLGGNPGLIYRVDPATGQASLFFDLNTVISQINPGDTASNSAGPSTGLVNWYDLAFDPEGYFDGRPSLFVSSVDSANPNKNAIYRIGPDGSFLGLFIPFTAGAETGTLTRTPSAILVPPPEQQSFLRGLLSSAGAESGFSFTTNAFTALFFDANAFRPGTPISSGALPDGAFPTNLTEGPLTGITAANSDYPSFDYATFADFGTPAGGGIPASPGFSGVQGLQGDFLVGANTNNGFLSPGDFSVAPTGVLSAGQAGVVTTQATATTPSGVDQVRGITTPFRRFQDTAFDQYGYFSQGATVTTAADGSVTVAPNPPNFTGSLFVADLATGLAVPAAFGTAPAAGTSNNPGAIPVQGGGGFIITTVNTTPDPDVFLDIQVFPGSNLGGRIIRIGPDGIAYPFAEGFNTSGLQDSGSFIESSLSITFSADGTTLYASDNDGIWQFKAVTSLAGATSGSLIGLNDLRSLGVPYEGQDTAVAVLDTGVDASTPNFRGRVAPGFNAFTMGAGNQDNTTTVIPNGHGTPVAGVIAQFVPQATIVPVNILAANTNPASTTNQLLYEGLDFIADNPFTRDPIRPNQVARVVATNIGLGTTETFDVEGTAYRAFPQIVAAFKNQLKRFRNLGIAPVAAAGQFGIPFNNDNFVNAGIAGDVRGIALPAILNEVVSVTGTYPFPYTNLPSGFTAADANSPIDPGPGFFGRLFSPVLLGRINTNAFPGDAGTLAAADTLIFKDKLLAAANRSTTTDYAAPALDVPTFRRTFLGDLNQHNVFQEAGTSISSAIVTGSFALVASALDYWSDVSPTGVTADGYLTTPVGARTLNFGPHQIRDLSIYATPDGINSILQWTAVPTTDEPIAGEQIFLDQPNLFGSERFRDFSRIDVGNAVAAIEASVALEYLFNNGLFRVIDANNNRLITAQEIQTFVDQSATIGLPEAGALARFLGGTARPPGESPIIDPANFQGSSFGAGSTRLGVTAVFEQPDRPDVLQRRYDFLDYAADGKLDGAISVDQLNVLAHTLLPAPDSFVIVDRQRASANNYLLKPDAGRNISDLQHILPTYAFVPARAVKRFRGFSPARFKVGRGVDPLTVTPTYTLFDPQQSQRISARRQQRRRPVATTAATTATTTPRPSGSTTADATSSASSGTSNVTQATLLESLRRLANVAPGATAAGQTPTDPGNTSQS